LRRTPQLRLAKIIVVVVIAGILTSCSSNPASSTNPGSGTLITIVRDVPMCNAISASVTVTGLSFTPVGGENAVGYITTTPSFAPTIRLNLQQLHDFSTILYSFPLQEGNYNRMNFAFELSQVAAYDPTLNPPVRSFSTTLVNPKPQFAINPPLTITAGKANVIVLDFDALRMLLTDSSGNLTGQVLPVVSLTQLSATSPTGAINPNGFAEIDDLWGFVRSISTTNATTNPNYIGNFNMQLLSPSVADAPALFVNLTATTNKIGFVDLSHLLPNSYVEADVTLDSDGNLVAKTVEVQAVENPFPSESGVTASTALIGPITSILTDPVGNPTQINLWVRDAEPDDTSTLTMDSIYQVNLSSNPTYQASALGPNFANLTFGAQNLAVGQELVVHGAYTKPPAQAGSVAPLPFTVAPTAIYLKLQSMQGTMTTMVHVGSDDQTGVFVLNPCCSLLQGTPIYVVTNNQTSYVNVTGLSGITTLNTLLVKGMPYYEPHAVTINGVTIPARAMVLQAKQVHVLQ
jgi:hypothetical protein